MIRSILTSLLFGSALILWVPDTRADRPGSYDGVLSVNPPRAAGGHVGGHVGLPGRGVRCRPGYGSTGLYFGVGPALGYPPFAYPMVYPPVGFPGYWGPTGIYYNPAANHVEYYLPPTYAPAELAYGPLAVERFLGVRRAPPAPVPTAIAPGVVARKPAAGGIATRIRKSNEVAKQRARRFISFGDVMFRAQRCHEAVQRYKSAVEAAPDMADAHYRQGFALIAVNQYKMAARSFKIAIELDPNIVHTGVKLVDLYGDHGLAKTSHLESLAKDALDRPGDGDLVFLVGMMLHADGEAVRARKFFQKASELAGPAATFLNALVAPLPPPDEPGDAIAPEEIGFET